MIFTDKCRGCEYYNKPCLSVVNPCTNCQRTSNNGYITTTTTNLPTAKEYRAMAEKTAFQFTSQWSEPKYLCPKCGGGMCRNEMVVLTSYPAKYEYRCNTCGHVEYQFM